MGRVSRWVSLALLAFIGLFNSFEAKAEWFWQSSTIWEHAGYGQTYSSMEERCAAALTEGRFTVGITEPSLPTSPPARPQSPATQQRQGLCLTCLIDLL